MNTTNKTNTHHNLETSHRPYERGLIDYADQQGAPIEAYRRAGWIETIRRGRRALEYPTPTGKRWRYIDGLEPRHDSPTGYKMCWHGLEDALSMGLNYLIQVNGAAGVVAAQWQGIPAFCVSGGESAAPKPHMMEQLQQVAEGLKIYVAFDCDTTGKTQAAKRARQYLDTGLIARAVDLQLGEHGDFADFLKIHGQLAPLMLDSLPEIAPEAPKETKLTYTGSVDDHRAEWERDEVLPALERTARMGQRKRFYCINPNHDDAHPSARVGQGQHGVTYFCSCGTFRLSTVGKWLGLDYRAWAKDKYPNQRHNKRAATPKRGRINGGKTASADALTVRYISDDLTPEKIHGIRTLTVGAPVGMGKTSAVAAYANRLPTDQQITGVAQYRLLTMAVASALKDSSHYEDSDHAHQRALGSMARLVTSLSSLPKFERTGGVVIADELEGDLQFLVNSGTFEGGEAVEAYRAFKALSASADQFIGMDANYSEISGNWLRAIRGDVTEKHYARQQSRGKVTFLANRFAAIWQVGKLLRQRRGQVYVACSSEATATDIADLFGGESYRILKVTRDTSNTQPVQSFIKNEQGERANYDLIVYTSAMGAGVDVSESVFALVGIFDRQPLAPENAMQLFGRVRNAQRYFAAVPPANEAYTTRTADDLLTDKLKREIWTAQRAGVDAQVSGDYLEMLQLWSQFEARRLRESAQWRHYFAQRLNANGYTVAVNPSKAPQAFIDHLKEWRQGRADENWQFVQNADGLGRSDDDLQKLRMAGVEITRELRLSNIRYKVERALGHDHITDLDRDLMTWHGRNRLFHLSDLFTDENELIAVDRQQATEGRPLQKRKHRTLNQRMIAALLRMADFTAATVEGQYLAFCDYFRTEHTADEISERFEAFTTQTALSKFQALGHYGNNARTAVGLCRWLLEYCGLKLNSIRRGRAEDRYMAYQLDAELLDYQLNRARRSAAERTRNVSIQGEYTFVVQPSDLAISRSAPPGEGWKLSPTPALGIASKAFTPTGTGGSKLNPFSVRA